MEVEVGGVGIILGGGVRAWVPVAACTRWLSGPDASTNTSVTWSTTESATQRSSSFSFSHSFLAHLSKALLALVEPGSAETASKCLPSSFLRVKTFERSTF